MDVIAIERSTYELLLTRLDEVTRKVKQLVAKSKAEPFDDYLDNQDVCVLINLSPRTLQSYRDTGKIAFCMIDRKVYYKRSDVQKFIDSRTVKGL